MHFYFESGKVFRKLWLVTCCGFALCCPLTSSANEPFSTEQSSTERYSCSNVGPIIFGILPFISAEQLVIRFTPLAHYLSKNLRTPVRIETAPNFVEFARRTHEDQRYDILFTAPHFYPQAHSKAGYRLIVGVDSPGMWAVIVVPRKSQIHNIDDLVGKRLATVHPAGLATLLVKKHLSDAGIDPDVDITMISTPSHDASLLSSYHGVTDASALMSPPYEAASAKVREDMRIIAKTESTPHIPISVSPRISESCAAEITEIMLRMGTTEEGRSVLKHNRFSGFKKTHLEDYEKVRDLLAR
jgi:phosphonate transport system substrate-binding protein